MIARGIKPCRTLKPSCEKTSGECWPHSPPPASRQPLALGGLVIRSMTWRCCAPWSGRRIRRRRRAGGAGQCRCRRGGSEGGVDGENGGQRSRLIRAAWWRHAAGRAHHSIDRIIPTPASRVPVSFDRSRPARPPRCGQPASLAPIGEHREISSSRKRRTDNHKSDSWFRGPGHLGSRLRLGSLGSTLRVHQGHGRGHVPKGVPTRPSLVCGAVKIAR